MSVENKLLLKVLETKDWETVMDKGITAKYFSGSNRRAFKWISDFKVSYGDIPTVETFKKHFPEVSLNVDAQEQVGYYCDEVRKKIRQNKLVSVLDQIPDKINKGDIDVCYEDLGKLLLEVNTDFTFTEKLDIGKNALQRFDDYQKSKLTGGMTGYSLGIKPIDKQTGGMKDVDLLTFLGRSGLGKATTLDTPILTTKGWKNMGDITYDDQLFGRDGKPCNITGIYPQGKKQVYRVHFVDGTFVDCCKDHLWYVNTTNRANKGYNEFKTYTTEDLFNEKDFKLRTDGGRKVFIPVTKPIQFEKKPLPIDPYVLGLLIGDGYLDCGDGTITFTNAESDVVATLKDKLQGIVEVLECPWNTIQYRLVKFEGEYHNTLKTHLRTLGLMGTKSATKFIPKDYLYSDEEDRRALLAGLIDTDGHITTRGATNFSTTSYQLAMDVMELGRGLGYRTYFNQNDRTLQGKGVEYSVHFSTKDHIATSNKHLVNYTKGVKSRKHFDRLYIDYIEILDKFEEMQCISVDSSDHTFICKDYIVTHNTWLLCMIAAKLIKAGYKVLFLTKEMSPNQLMKRMDAIMAQISYSRFKKGTLTPAEEEQYRIYLEQYAPRYADRLSIEMVLNGVNECVAKVDAYQPDVLLVDGGYLMAEGADPEDWKAVLSVWKAFKVMALSRKIPVVVTSQLTDKGSVAYATSLKQYCDGIWCLKQNDVQKAEREISIETLKIRDGEHITPFTMSWDFTEANGFGEVLFETFDGKESFFKKEEPNSLTKL